MSESLKVSPRQRSSETLFLIAKYLAAFPELADTAKFLEEKLVSCNFIIAELRLPSSYSLYRVIPMHWALVSVGMAKSGRAP